MPTVKELRAEAKRRGLRGYSAMNKAQLLEVLGTRPPSALPTPEQRFNRRLSQKAGGDADVAMQAIIALAGGLANHERLGAAMSLARDLLA